MKVSIQGPVGVGKTSLATVLGLERLRGQEHVYAVPNSAHSSVLLIQVDMGAGETRRVSAKVAGAPIDQFVTSCTFAQLPMVAALLRTTFSFPII